MGEGAGVEEGGWWDVRVWSRTGPFPSIRTSRAEPGRVCPVTSATKPGPLQSGGGGGGAKYQSWSSSSCSCPAGLHIWYSVAQLGRQDSGRDSWPLLYAHLLLALACLVLVTWTQSLSVLEPPSFFLP